MRSVRNGDQPPIIHTWLERFGKQNPRSFSSATTPVDVENWISHIEKIFEVLGCADEFKARLASYRFEGDALIWWKVFKQAKRGETYMATLSWKDFCDIFFLQYFPSFCVLGVVLISSLVFLGVLGVWSCTPLSFHRLSISLGSVWMHPRVLTVAVMTGRVATVIRSYDITEVSSTTVLLGLQVRKDAWTMPPLLHVTYVGNFIRARHVIGLLELVSLMQSRIQCYNYREYGHVERECQKMKWTKDAAYHKEKMLLCKQEEAGIQLSAKQVVWRDDTDDEPGDQKLEAHYMYMAKIQEVTPNDVDNYGPIFDAKPLQKLVEIIQFIVDSGCSKHMTRNLKLLSNFVEKFLGTVKFGNDQIAPILGYGHLVQRNVTIKRVYYIEGMDHNLFFVGQFCDADLEVAF
ncbi:hypothetical protein Tco_0454369 [Tanacetum coccineum]